MQSALSSMVVKVSMKQDDDRDQLQKELRRDEKTQLIVGCIGSAADIIEFVSETVGDQPGDLCNSKLHLILWLCWSLRNNSLHKPNVTLGAYPRTDTSWSTSVCVLNLEQSLFQFIFSFAPYSNRIRPDAERVGHFLMQTEVWSIFILLGFQEIPFLFARTRDPAQRFGPIIFHTMYTK